MPELPEVETVKNSLKELVLNKTIKEVEVRYNNIVKTDLDIFKNSLVNKTIKDIKRIGKHLIFEFDELTHLVSHLRMEGKYFLHSDNELSKHDHVIFYFTDETNLRYNDTRKFGTMHLFLNKTYDEIKCLEPLKQVGLEPFDKNFTLDYLKPKFKSSTKPIKTTILDQSIIAGLGNIYADEVLFESKIHPLRKTNSINDEEISSIITSSIKVLNKAITLGGTTIKSFVNSHMATGLFQNKLNIHTKKTCKVCNNNVLKRYVGGRGTYYCIKCQQLPFLKVAITSSIACGKSTVLEYLKQKGYTVISLDQISKDLLSNPSSSLYQNVLNSFDCKSENNTIDRKKLAKIIFENNEEKEKLNNIMHPEIIKEMQKQIDEVRLNSRVVFVEVPLLYEKGLEYLEDYFDEVICVYCDRKTQLERLMSRDNIDEKYALNKINSQILQDVKKKKAHFVVDNSYSIEYTKENVDKILEQLN